MSDLSLSPAISPQHDSHIPICLFLTRLPDREVQALEVDLAKGWGAIDKKASYARDFKFFHWKGTSSNPSSDSSLEGCQTWPSRGETDATLKQIYQLARHIDQKATNACIMIDAVSGRNLTVILAHFDNSQANLKLGRVAAHKGASALLDLSNKSFETLVDDFPGSITVRDLDLSPGGSSTGATSEDKTPSTLTKLPTKQDMDPSIPLIFSITQISGEEQEGLKQKLSQSLQGIQEVTLLQWENDHEGSLADMYNISRQDLTGSGPPNEPICRHVLFLDTKSKTDGTVIWSRFVNLGPRQEVVKYKERSLRLDFARIQLDQLGDAWKVGFKDQGRNIETLEEFVKDPSSIETILDPNAPLNSREPIYLPQGRVNFANTAAPVFFLTNLPAAEEEAVRTELETIIDVENYPDNDEDPKRKQFCYVPWLRPGEEGGSSTMLKIMSYTRLRHELFVYIFVDARSGKDQSIILAEHTDEKYGFRKYKVGKEPREGYAEFRFLRVKGRMAQIDWINLDIANMGIEELEEDGEVVEWASESEEEVRVSAREAVEEGLVEGREWERLVRERERVREDEEGKDENGKGEREGEDEEDGEGEKKEEPVQKKRKVG